MLPVHLYIRPGAQDFIKEMAKHYELVVFTASKQVYANKVIDIIDPDRHIAHRLYRESCVEHKSRDFEHRNASYWVKDLSRLSRFIDDIVIVDNSPAAYIYQKENALPISSWTGGKDDCELYKYINMLKMMAKFEIDIKYVVLNIVNDDFSLNHDKFAEIINSAISKPNFSLKTKDYRKAHELSKSPARRKHCLLFTRNAENAMFQTISINTQANHLTTENDSDSDRLSANYLSV